MSLYHHVANKDDILDGMVDIVFSEIDLPPDDHRLEDGDASTGTLGSRGTLTRHPWAIGLMESRTSPARRTCGTTTR